jgi:hypothetical protein
MQRLTLHSFTMGDVDDVEIYVAQPIYEWQQTEQGRWCTEHATNLHWLTGFDPTSFGYRITITGDLEDKLATEFLLRWKNAQS